MKANVLFNFPLALLLCCACVKEQPGGGEEGKLYELTGFTALTEDGADAKTNISHNGAIPEVHWAGKESVTVISSKDGTSAVFTKNDENKTKIGHFDGYLASYSPSYYIGYPSTANWRLDGENLKFRIPQTTELSLDASKCMMSMAYLTDPNSNATFYNLFALLRLTFQGNGSQDVRKIEIHDLGGKMLWGDVSIPASILEHPEIYGADDWWEHMTITGGSSKLTLTRSTARVFGRSHLYIPVPQGTLDKGVRVVVYKYDGSKHVPIDEFCSSELTMTRSHIRPMPEVTLGEFSLLDVDGEKNETANSYFVDRNQLSTTFKFCATQGNGGAVKTINSVEDLWETCNNVNPFNNGNIGFLLETSTIAYDKGCIKFQIKQYLETGKSAQGNAVIAARDKSSNILWSWHLCLPYSVPIGEITLGNGTKSMDRNLGAVVNAAQKGHNGLLYQWGRKDPFPAPLNNGTTTRYTTNPADPAVHTYVHDMATIAASIANPTTLYSPDSGSWDSANEAAWSDSKNIYDPCPPGWRVPSREDYNNLTFNEYDSDMNAYQEKHSGLWFHGVGRTYWSTTSEPDDWVFESATNGHYWTTGSGTNLAYYRRVFHPSGAPDEDPEQIFAEGWMDKRVAAGVRCVKE